MNLNLYNFQGTTLGDVQDDGIVIRTAQDALDLLANAGYQGADKLIVHERHLSPDFFDLKTGLAGEMLQKFSNYRVQLAIVGDFARFTSPTLRDFIRESNRHGHIRFVRSVEEARAQLTNTPLAD
ncbi:protein of unknown function [Catalinimonas alkaloidigena]|uniref:DUF4180 domain-containing protein n=1 Tax=Catalinimonas alkaloidigena TaxID=1075417 RepID=A0A1G9SKA7_9BACT|nr:DUF4180 domain-containing protein [Catalinimonas alkaloidigena]SDM35841.1 protein of unknown function [Catalinimonas alkaloidigena]